MNKKKRFDGKMAEDLQAFEFLQNQKEVYFYKYYRAWQVDGLWVLTVGMGLSKHTWVWVCFHTGLW